MPRTKRHSNAITGGVQHSKRGYQNPAERLGEIETAYGRFQTDEPMLQAIRDGSQQQKCGGGRRIIRKNTPE